MTDEDFDNKDEDFASEFDFVENKGPATPSNTAAVPRGDTQNSPKIVAVLFLISILGGGYYAYNHFFSKTELPAAPKLPETAQHTLPPAPAPAEMHPAEHEAQVAAANPMGEHHDELAAALPPPPAMQQTATGGTKSFEQVQRDLQASQQNSQTAAVPTEIRTTLQNISDEMTVNVNNIKQLESTIAALTSTLDQLNKTVNAMDNRVLGLTETVDGLSHDLANVKKIMVDEDLDLTSPGSIKLNGAPKMQPVSNAASYSVHAIIPGRAWLKSSSGQIITVTEGDTVGDLGKVAVIDASNGLVRTSSGIIIR